MQVSIETTQGLERKMTIAVPSEQVDTAVNARLQEAAKNIRMNGFRKGKVPLKVVKDRYGKGVRQEVAGELMSQSYYEALNEQSIKPAGQPRIEATKLEEGEDLEFTAVFEVYPEIELPDFSKIKAEQLQADVEDADIDEMIETLRKQRQTWSEVDRAAADKDMVNIDYVGRKDGEEFDGGKAAGTNLVLGSERMIPGFEDGIIGKKPGEEFTLKLTFPEEYQNADLAGQEVEFDLTLNTVSEQTLPEVNEEFYASFGVEEGGMEAFREEVANNMRRELKTATRNKLKNKIMDELLKLVDVTVPAALIAGEVDQLRNQALQQMGGGQNIDKNMLPDELFREQANRRVVLGLVLGEVIQDQGMKADPDKVRTAVEELASTYESPEEVVNWYYGNEEQLSAVESSVMEDQVFDYIIEQAAVAEKKVSYEDAIKQEPREPAADQSDAESEEEAAKE
ncbi:MAG: trigger factor [Gammaproteobacteria bacterium]